MPKETTDEAGSLVLAHGEVNQAVVGVTKTVIMETRVTCKEGWSLHAMQQGYDPIILHP
jgi:hypothetical protein